MRWPVLNATGLVVNVIELIDGAAWLAPDGVALGVLGGEVGDTWNGVTYIRPAAGLPTPTVDDVISERARRLALGFDYDFGDARGVHRIGTTPADMAGWDEVAKGALAAIALGQPQTAIEIITDTGAVTLTALEWQSVIAAATAWRQAVWHASFALQALAPIPAAFADDARWPPVS